MPVTDFILVGARFSKILIDEDCLLDGKSEYNVTIEGGAPTVSSHKYDERPVIELKVSMSAKSEDAVKLNNVFRVECTAGFVSRDGAHDGDLEMFGASKDFFMRAVYWMLRERVDSIFAVTMLRTAQPIPWDLVTSLPEVIDTDNRPKSTRSRKKSTSKHKVS